MVTSHLWLRGPMFLILHILSGCGSLCLFPSAVRGNLKTAEKGYEYVSAEYAFFSFVRPILIGFTLGPWAT